MPRVTHDLGSVVVVVTFISHLSLHSQYVNNAYQHYSTCPVPDLPLFFNCSDEKGCIMWLALTVRISMHVREVLSDVSVHLY